MDDSPVPERSIIYKENYRIFAYLKTMRNRGT